MLVDLQNNNTEIARRNFTQTECERPHVAVLQDQTTLFLVCEGDEKAAGRVLKIDATTLATVESTDVGLYPDAFILAGAGAQ